MKGNRKGEIKMSNEERMKSQKNAEEFCEHLHKIDKNFGVDIIKVNEVGGINQECVITYLGVKLAHVPPRPPALFGYRLYGEDTELQVGKNQRIYSEHERNILENHLIKKAKAVKQALEEERTKQKSKEDKARQQTD